MKGDSKGQGMESNNGVCTFAHPNIPIRATSNSSDVAKKREPQLSFVFYLAVRFQRSTS